MALEFYIAEHLGMTVAELRATISEDEFVRWGAYFARRNQMRELALKGRHG